jgi:hypothetical protein
MTLIPIPIAIARARLVAIFTIFLCLVFGGALYREEQYFAGIVLFGIAGILLLGVVVYSAQWFQNLDQSLRIFQLMLGLSIVGGVAGLVLYGMEGAVFGWTYTLLCAELVGAVCALFFRYRDEKEMREYETEMRKYGKEP